MSKDGNLLVKKSQAIIADSKVTIARSKSACKRARRLNGGSAIAPRQDSKPINSPASDNYFASCLIVHCNPSTFGYDFRARVAQRLCRAKTY